jgi:hypothetical protein
MLPRVAVALCACVLGVASAGAEELSPQDARAFVVGKLFSYTCFDGTAGMGRIFADGSVVGTIRPMGRGEVRFAALPAGTLQVKNGAMCTHLNGLPVEPCFRVQRIDHRRFRGSISGLGSLIATSISTIRARRSSAAQPRRLLSHGCRCDSGLILNRRLLVLNRRALTSVVVALATTIEGAA